MWLEWNDAARCKVRAELRNFHCGPIVILHKLLYDLVTIKIKNLSSTLRWKFQFSLSLSLSLFFILFIFLFFYCLHKKVWPKAYEIMATIDCCCRIYSYCDRFVVINFVFNEVVSNIIWPFSHLTLLSK